MAGFDRIVPFTVEIVTDDLDRLHFGFGNNNPFAICPGIKLAGDFQTRLGRCCADQINDDLVAHQWFRAPVLGDESEQPMLDLVPFAGSWRQMANRDRQAQFIGEILQFALP